MEKKYIRENRYKKSTTRKQRNLSAIHKPSAVKTKKVIKKRKPRLRPGERREKRINRKNIFTCVILLILIVVILRALLKEEGEPFIPIFFTDEENTQVISVGVITDEDLLSDNINNVVLKELGYYSHHMLLGVNEDYTLKYDAIQSIEKNTQLEYIINLNESKEYNANSVKQVLERYLNDKTSTYNTQLSDIQSISVLGNQQLKITLKNSNPYFVYNLDIPITKTSKKEYRLTDNSTNTSVEFERTKYASEQAPAKIIVKRYKDMYAAVEAYKKGTISMFITNQKNVQNMLGKYEYNLKKYRNGETIFLFLNENSEWLQNEEIRKVIAYSIDRDNIIQDVMQSAANVIDLPYIYDIVKYKYDIYAAENLLLSNGYKKQNKVYVKNKKQVELNLIVNKSDDEKVQIAKAIQNNLAAIGIKVDIEKLAKTDLIKRLEKGNYDLVLSTVNINNKPDITFIQKNMYMTEQIQEGILKIEQATVGNIPNEINNISRLMSNNISCIGIVAKTNYVVYSKEILGITDISYLNIFTSLVNEGERK